MRTLAICLLALATVGLAGDGSERRVTVVHELVVARVVHSDHQHSEHRPVKRSHPRHAPAERSSFLVRVGRAIGITVHHR